MSLTVAQRQSSDGGSIFWSIRLKSFVFGDVTYDGMFRVRWYPDPALLSDELISIIGRCYAHAQSRLEYSESGQVIRASFTTRQLTIELYNPTQHPWQSEPLAASVLFQRERNRELAQEALAYDLNARRERKAMLEQSIPNLKGVELHRAKSDLRKMMAGDWPTSYLPKDSPEHGHYLVALTREDPSPLAALMAETSRLDITPSSLERTLGDIYAKSLLSTSKSV